MKRILQPERVLRAALFVLLLSVVGMTKANPVDMRTAREVGMKFMNTNTNTPLRSIDDLQLVTTYNINRGDAAFYVFNTPNGFVIVSADDCATPILGYSDEGQFDMENIPIQLQDYLQGFVEQIQYGIENHLESDEQTDQQWEMVRTIGRLSNNRFNRTVEPLLTTIWDQDCFYNEMCPEDWLGMCGHVYTGCVATAMAQIMHYWGYPENGAYSHSYIPLDPYTYLPSDYPEQSVDFWATTYDWDNMPNQLDGTSTYEQIEAVATLMWHCGVSVDMMYSPTGSAAYSYLVEYALEDYFTYSDESSYEYKFEFSDASWKAKLKDCLNLGRPVYYDGFEHSLLGGSGHAFVCDGYDNDEMFHFNWGWSGLGNGYFAIDALIVMYYEFNYNNTAIFNIHPQGETTNYVINVSVDNDEGGTVSGGGIFAHGDIVTLTAIADEGYGFCYWEENGGIVSTDPNYSFTANYNRDLVAVFAGPFSVTVSAEEGGVATGGGSYFYGESCTVIASANEGYAFSFWTDNGEVVSYNANYIFPVTSETHLIAHFALSEGNIIFADVNVKALCVANWDTDGNGMLSYTEAASVTSLGQVFRDKANIYSFDELQYFTNVTSIGNYAFYNCSGLTSLTFPNAVTSIGNSAFQYCSNLTGSLTIPDAVTSIGSNAFNNCSALTSITIGNSVNSIGNSTFYSCSGLTSLIILSEGPPTIGTDAFKNVSTDIPVFVPCGSVEAYQATEGWNVLSNIMGMCSFRNVTVAADPSEGGTVTGGGNFEAGTFCTVNAMPNEGYGFAFWTKNGNIVSHDANYSFIVTGDSQIIAHFISTEENIIFADANVKGICVSMWDTNGDGELSTAEAAAVTSLGSVFRNNKTISSFEELQYFIGLTSIGGYAFSGCTGLTGSPVIPNFVITIGNSAFSRCTGLVSLTFSSSVVTISSSAFSGCSGLNAVYYLGNINQWCSIQFSEYASNPLYFAHNLYIGNELVTDLVIPETVIEIKKYAFRGATCLTSLTIPNSVTTIGSSAFSGCTGLTGSLVIPNSVTTIGSNAFSYCIGLSGSLVIPNSVTTIGDGAFGSCHGFTGNLTIPNSVTTIGECAFDGCHGFTGDLVIPNSLSSINNYTFRGCNGFTGNLTIPNSVTTIGNGAFDGCHGFTGNLIIPNSVTTIGDVAFGSCHGFTGNLTIPNSVTTIGEWAFDGCHGFTGDLVIPNSVSSINNYTFRGCNGFTGNLTIPNSVTTIGESAFEGCTGLTSLTLLAETPPAILNSFPDCPTSIPVYVPCGSVEAYQSAEYWSWFYNIQEGRYDIEVSANTEEGGSVSGTGNYCLGTTCTITATANDGYNFQYWTKNDSVVSDLPTYSFIVSESANYVAHFESVNGNIVFADANVKAICVANWDTDGDGELSYGEAAAVTSLGEVFRGNTEITSFEELQFFTGLQSISNNAFRGCSSLTGSLMLPNSITSIGSYAFYGCESFIGELTIPNTVTSIGNYAFYQCRNLTGLLTIPDSVTSLGSCVFAYCSGISGIIIPNSITVIPYNAFHWCEGLISLSLPNSITLIGSGAFAGCHSLTGILNLPNTVFNIGSLAFFQCENLTGPLTIPSSVTSIGNSAFNGCSGLTGPLTLPNAITSLGNQAFSGCRGLRSMIVLSEQPPTLGSNVFYEVIPSIPIYVSCESIEVYQSTVGWNAFSNIIGICSSGTISVVADPIEGGEVTGGGTYEGGAVCTVNATPNEGYYFANWTQNGSIVSYDSNYSFVVTGESVLTAHFVTEGNIVFADTNVKDICVANWDTNGDGELSYVEASKVAGLREVFAYNTEITAFEELQFFIGLSSISNHAFRGCSNLTGSLIIPDFVNLIGDCAFLGCSGFTGTLTIPNSVTIIGNTAFGECSGLTGSLTIPNSVVLIDMNAFHNCSGLTESLTIGNSVTSIGSYAFCNCSGFTGTLTLPNSLTSIDHGAFCYCYGFTGDLFIPNSVNSIGDYAFYYCNMTSVIIGSSVTTIGNYAFCGCNDITSMFVLTEQPPTLGSNAFNSVNTGIPVYVPCESVEAYQSAAGWEDFPNLIGMCSSGTIAVAADPMEGGMVAGSGTYEGGTLCTVIATPNEGYGFTNWTENDNVVSYDSNYCFVATGDRMLTAHFVTEENIDFADANVKAICVANWDTNGDGELSYYEASIVTSLGEVFRGNTEITSFEELQYFTGLLSISAFAFYGCSGLTGSLIIPNAVTSIGTYAFYHCNGLTGSLIIPSFVNSIGTGAFSNCSGLTGSLTIPNTVTTIGTHAFYNCSGLTGPLVIGNSVTSVGSYAFYNCYGLTSLTIPNSVTSIGDFVFRGEGLKSVVVLAELPPTMEWNTFFQINHNIPVHVPCESVEAYQSAVGWSSFLNIIGMCSSGTISVVADPIEGGDVTGAGTYESGEFCTVTAAPNEGYYFANWTANGSVVSYDSNYSFVVTGESVLIAHFVTEGNIVFADANVKAICVSNWDTNGDGELSYAEAAAVSSLGEVFRGNTEIISFEELQFFIGLPSINDYAFRDCTGLSGLLKLPNSVTSIGDCAFSGCSGFTGNLIIPSSVTTIEQLAFNDCNGFTGSLIIPNSVISIGSHAFSGCNGFTGNLTIGNSVTSIGYRAFYECSGFAGNLTIGNSVTSIGGDAFYNCSGLTGSLTIPNSVTSIEDAAFYGCSGLTGNLTIPNSVTTIENWVFSGCSGLTGNLVIPNSVISIGYSAFRGCSGLSGNLTIPNTVTSIDSYAFYGCNSLTGTLTIPNSVTTIGNYIFYNCSGFTGDLTIPNSVVLIGNYAFYNCSGLSSLIVLPHDPPVLGNVYVFSGVNKSIPVYVPCGSLEAYQNATGWSEFTNIQEMCSQQTITLSEGWNWFSTYLEITDPVEMLQMLEEALGENGLQIKNDNISTEYDSEWGWFGDLDEVGFTNEEMIMIKTAAACTLELQGTPTDPAIHPITINPGWNWIGYPCAEEMTLEEAFSNFTPEDGDKIKNSEGSSEYDAEWGWFGDVETFIPGQGFMYYSSSVVIKTLVFQVGRK